ncbi:MBL fold metallo-hydrolase [Xylophilus sp. GOD-11R]|uniref:MBL fold metallo-hydrolase n=1 Tax=Xylophilus sp. GOD-11R TaxID=3089814 RepID=UPI00298C7B88|nr:MBL fold metallo-hydrolase [Xylophilus sp. GOD-11R]WPB56409.1 MBL fold metallo-hydrolase [Xylophilus sp. GOD-11R]
MTLSIQSFFDPDSATFSYLVDDGQGRCAVVDPVVGFDPAAGRVDRTPAERIGDTIEARGLQLDWLLETHAHADHLSGAPLLQKRLGGTLAIGSGIRQVQQVFRGIFNLDDPQAAVSPFGRLFEDGETFFIGSLRAEVMHLPGHTPADVAYRVFDPQGASDAVFVGDTVFAPDVGTARCDFPGGDAHQLYRSIRRLLALPPQTRLFLCHDYPPAGREVCPVTTVAEQRAANVHMHEGVSEEAFVARRQARDATLAMPRLMLPSIQVNIHAGQLPAQESNGTVYLKIPIDRF